MSHPAHQPQAAGSSDGVGAPTINGTPLPPCAPSDPDPVLRGDEVSDLVNQFHSLSPMGEWLGAWPGRQVHWPRYTETGENDGGANNHFQGFQRLYSPGHAVISGGDPHAPMSHVFVIKLESRGVAGVWGSNLLHGEAPPAEDRILSRIDLDGTLWHAGGMCLVGDVLSVPIENSDGGASRIEFLNMANPAAPKRFAGTIARPRVKAGAVAFTRLSGGRYLVAVWSDSEREPPTKHLDLYVSERPSLHDPGWSAPICVTTAVADVPKFQTISLLWDVDTTGARCGLYLAGFENAATLAPSAAGPHYGRVYAVSLPAGAGGNPGDQFRLDRLEPDRVFTCDESFCDMDAATGVFVTPEGRLLVYSAHHFLRPLPAGIFRARKFIMRFEEFAATDFAGRTLESIDGAWVELYDGTAFGGRRVSLHGSQQAVVDDLAKLRAGGEAFGDRVSSLRCQLPRGFALVLYRVANHRGERPLVVVGTGEVVAVSDLAAQGFADVARSCRIVASRAAPPKEQSTWLE